MEASAQCQTIMRDFKGLRLPDTHVMDMRSELKDLLAVYNGNIPKDRLNRFRREFVQKRYPELLK